MSDDEPGYGPMTREDRIVFGALAVFVLAVCSLCCLAPAGPTETEKMLECSRACGEVGMRRWSYSQCECNDPREPAP